ncbi:hypothetical protein [Helicobacter pylori]|uniref:hypothetical protein n=1 Tax=Helicobacter pylori TaxID=210 RepID=UPI00028642A3|nr:hypothetical protein [Helicobacter pylori]EKE86643.1 hypothetical protein OUG_0906 [Helicobacter pylori R32b]
MAKTYFLNEDRGYFEIILSIIPLTQKDRFLRNYRLLKIKLFCCLIFKNALEAFLDLPHNELV